MPLATPNWPDVKRVLDGCPIVDEYQGYYRQSDVPFRRISNLIPSTHCLLRAAFRPDMRVLDIGCGRGDTLLACASLFRHGDGIDESGDVMISHAVAEQARLGITNLAFHAAKAAALPFEDAAFDLVFTERGPMCHQDQTLREALRVLRPGGHLVIETIGEWNSWETRCAFEVDYRRPTSPFGWLEIEQARLERHGVQVRKSASRLESLEFDSFDDWIRYQVYTWSPPGRDAFTPENMPAIRRFVQLASELEGKIRVTVHTLLLTGTKGDR